MNQTGLLWVLLPEKTVLPYSKKRKFHEGTLFGTHTKDLCVSIFVFKSLPLFVMWLIVQQLLPKHVMCVNLSADVHIGANLWCGQIFFWVTEDMSYILCSGFLWPRVSSFSPSIMYLEKIGGEKKALFLDSLEYLLTDQLCLQLKYQLWE